MSTDITSRWKMLFQSLRPMKTRYSYILFLLLAINSYTALIAQQLPSLTDSRLCIAKLKMRDGMFYGYLPLPSDLHSGQYTLAVHTHYQHLIPDDYICKRVVNVLTQQHLRAGYTVLPLYEHQLVLADSLASSDITYNRIRRTDTLQHVHFQAPANTWFAISVTDDQLSPIDTSHTITLGLISIPDFFTHDNLLKLSDELRDNLNFYSMNKSQWQ